MGYGWIERVDGGRAPSSEDLRDKCLNLSSPSGSGLLRLQFQTSSQLQLKFYPNHRAQVVVWVPTPDLIMTGIVVQKRWIPHNDLTFLAISTHISIFLTSLFKTSHPRSNAGPTIDDLSSLESGQTKISAYGGLPGTSILTGYDAEKGILKREKWCCKSG